MCERGGCPILEMFRDAATARGFDPSQIVCPMQGRPCADINRCYLYATGYGAIREIAAQHGTSHASGEIIQPAQPVNAEQRFFSRLSVTDGILRGQNGGGK